MALGAAALGAAALGAAALGAVVLAAVAAGAAGSAPGVAVVVLAGAGLVVCPTGVASIRWLWRIPSVKSWPLISQ